MTDQGYGNQRRDPSVACLAKRFGKGRKIRASQRKDEQREAEQNPADLKRGGTTKRPGSRCALVQTGVRTEGRLLPIRPAD